MPKRLLVPSFEQAKELYKGPRFSVHTLNVANRKGNPARRDVVVHPGAVVILPLLDRHHLIMIRNKRFAVSQDLWELPAGILEKDEEPEETAKREIVEETGYKAENLEPLLSFYTTPGICNEAMYAYVATGLTYVGQSLEDSEEITVEVVEWQTAMTWVRDGIIIDGKTITTILYYNTFNP